MVNNIIYQEDGYFLFCSAMHMSDDTWSASVLFEKKAHYGLARSLAMRHTITSQKFATEKEAVNAAYQFGRELIATRSVGLD